MTGPYRFGNTQGAPWAIRGRWRVEGPAVEPLYFGERTTAAVVARALNLAWAAGEAAAEDKYKATADRSEEP